MKPMNHSTQPDSRFLQPGTILPHNYIIQDILGEGGFAIVYRAVLPHSEECYSVKEYFPVEFSHRIPEKQTVVPFSGRQEPFEKGRQRFLAEAGFLREFQQLAHIVSVRDLFEANGTVYMVMDYLEGITLKNYVEENDPLSPGEFFPLIVPVMLELIHVHRKGWIHRDITPDNLILGTDNQLHLVDFGSGDLQSSAGRQEHTVMLTSGFAPPEQYLQNGSCGPWTDIYGLSATAYYALTGIIPEDAIQRLGQDSLTPLSGLTDLSDWQAAAIEKGMRPRFQDRFSDMEEFYQALVIPPLETVFPRTSRNTADRMRDKTVMPSFQPASSFLHPAFGSMMGSRQNTSPSCEHEAGTMAPRVHTKKGRHIYVRPVTILPLFLFLALGTGLWIGNSLLPPKDSRITKDSTGNGTPADSGISADITVSTEQTLADNSSAAGQILTGDTSIRQFPTEITSSAQTSAKETSPAPCYMINVTGFSLADARLALQALDSSIQVDVAYEADPSQKEDIVLRQSIAEHTGFTAGSISHILLTVNRLTSATETQQSTSAARITGKDRKESSQAPKAQTTQNTDDAGSFIQSDQDINFISD